MESERTIYDRKSGATMMARGDSEGRSEKEAGLERGREDRELLEGARGFVEDLGVEKAEALLKRFESAGEERPQKDVSRARVGPFRLRRILGEGGMGVVYLANQEEPVRREVALKLISPHHMSETSVFRFEQERQALAMLEHPNIARVYEAGETVDGHPYLAMEYVSGQTLDKFCEESDPSLEERLRVFLCICRAVQYAHLKGVLHRDLKPSNVLISREGERAVVKVIDFGLAKSTKKELSDKEMATWAPVGTRPYMSPEQFGLFRAGDVDTRTDIYSLGVILYELLTGKLPFDWESFDGKNVKVFRKFLEEETPVLPSARLRHAEQRKATREVGEGTGSRESLGESRLAFSRRVRNDLDWITMKALSKDREERYGTVAELATEIERYLRHEPVSAGPLGWSYRVRKFVRRNRGATSFVCALAVALVAGLVGTLVGLAEAQREAEVAVRASRNHEHAVDFLSKLLYSVDPTVQGMDVRFYDAFHLAVQRVEGHFLEDPAGGASLQFIIGQIYSRFGKHEAADHRLRAAYEGAVELDPEGALVAKILGTRALVAMGLDRLEEAETLAKRAVDLAGRVLDPEDRDYLVLRHGYAQVLFRREKMEEADLLLRDVFTARQRLFGADDRDTLNSLNNLAVRLRQQNDKEGAEELYRQFFKLGNRALGPNDLYLGFAKYNYGVLLSISGRLEEAESFLKDALRVLQDSLSDGSFQVARAKRELGALYLRSERPEQARPLLEAAVNTFSIAVDSDPRLILTTKSDLGRCLVDLGEFKEAHRVLENVVDRCPNELPRVWISAHWGLALACEGLGRPKDAWTLCKRVLRRRRAVQPELVEAIQEKIEKLESEIREED